MWYTVTNPRQWQECSLPWQMHGKDQHAVYRDKHTATSQCTMANEGKDQSVGNHEKRKATLQCTTAKARQHYSVPRQTKGNITVYHGKRKATLQCTTANERQHYNVPRQSHGNITMYHGNSEATLQRTTAITLQCTTLHWQTQMCYKAVNNDLRKNESVVSNDKHTKIKVQSTKTNAEIEVK